MNTIYTAGESFLFDDVKNGNYHFADKYLQHTFEFCESWLNNQDHFVFNTSGSTGCPMAIDAQRSQMVASARGTIAALALTSREHIYLCISTKMIGGAMMIVRALELGCDITIVHPTSNPVDLLSNTHNYTLASFVPMQVFDIERNAEMINKLNRFENILLGGAAASDNIISCLEQLDCRVWQTYGMTETLSHIALKLVGKDKYLTALPGVCLKTDERSCLCIKAEVTNGRWLVTNDLVKMADEKHFELLGRMDDVINSGGIKIFTYDVELAINELLNTLEMPHKSLFVYRQTDEKFGEIVVAVMLGKPLNDEIIKQIMVYCTDKLGKYAAPRHIYFTNEFVKLESGKINKSATLKKVLMDKNHENE